MTYKQFESTTNRLTALWVGWLEFYIAIHPQGET